jgi:hypothetical protein
MIFPKVCDKEQSLDALLPIIDIQMDASFNLPVLVVCAIHIV